MAVTLKTSLLRPALTQQTERFLVKSPHAEQDWQPESAVDTLHYQLKTRDSHFLFICPKFFSHRNIWHFSKIDKLTSSCQMFAVLFLTPDFILVWLFSLIRVWWIWFSEWGNRDCDQDQPWRRGEPSPLHAPEPPHHRHKDPHLWRAGLWLQQTSVRARLGTAVLIVTTSCIECSHSDYTWYWWCVLCFRSKRRVSSWLEVERPSERRVWPFLEPQPQRQPSQCLRWPRERLQIPFIQNKYCSL